MISVVFGWIFGQTENIFSLTEFYITTKRLIFRKMISENQFQSKQTEPKALFGFFFSSFIIQFSSLITHHLKYPTRLASSLTCHHSIFFTLFVGPIPITQCNFFFLQSLVPKLTKPSEKKKKKKKTNWQDSGENEEKKEKKRERTEE